MNLYRYVATLFLILCFGVTFAQEEDTTSTTDSLPSFRELMNMDVVINQDLMNVPVSVAGQKDQYLQEAPSIISVVTKQDIATFGYRDISEVLRMVPGFEFGYDVEGLSGMSFRGIWAHEGKALMMINGVVVNDLAYGNTNPIGAIPVAMIERVEVIRGPGSAIYGGFAGVVVINIITTSATAQKSGDVTVQGGAFGSKSSSAGAFLNYGVHAKNANISVNLGYADRPLSDRRYNDFFGNSLKMDNSTAYRQYLYAIAKGTYKNLSFNYHRTMQDFAGQDGNKAILPFANGRLTETYSHTTEALILKQAINLSSYLKLEPSFEVVRGNPLTSALLPTNVRNGQYSLQGATKLSMYTGKMKLDWDLRRFGQVTAGGAFVRNVFECTAVNGTPGVQTGPNVGDTGYIARNEQKSLLLEYTNKFDVFGITLGSRYESTPFGDAFAPRAGLTYSYKKMNAKLLYGRAYRIPLLVQSQSRGLNYSGNLRPETSNTIELEFGYKFNKNISARFNVFDTRISDVITYYSVNSRYVNAGNLQSQGIEAEVAARFSNLGAFLNASYCQPTIGSSPNTLTMDKDGFLGIPRFKLNAGAYYTWKHLNVAPSLTLLSSRVGQSSDTLAVGNTTYPGLVLVNLAITYNGLIKNLDLRFSGSNLLNADYLLIQPYYGGHAPMPTNDRQLTLTAIYTLP
jgi:outer membrane cobalamin receptor